LHIFTPGILSISSNGEKKCNHQTNEAVCFRVAPKHDLVDGYFKVAPNKLLPILALLSKDNCCSISGKDDEEEGGAEELYYMEQELLGRFDDFMYRTFDDI
jgi:hypothetical protein